MKKNTLKAIQKRLDQGLTEFSIGEKFYYIGGNCLLSQYRNDAAGIYDSDGPMIEGVIVNGVLDPKNIFTPEEKAARAAYLNMDAPEFWYAVLTGPDDTDLSTGSPNLDEATDMLKRYRDELGYLDAYIAVIDDRENPVCIDTIEYWEID